jgi:hypothetical protein
MAVKRMNIVVLQIVPAHGMPLCGMSINEPNQRVISSGLPAGAPTTAATTTTGNRLDRTTSAWKHE